MISAIVLAAGESRRMGRAKQLLEWEGKSLLDRVLENLQGSRVDEVILVLGHEAEEIRKKVDTCGARVVINNGYKEGMITSIHQGLKVLSEKAEAFFIVLADQPGIGPEIFNRLISEWQKTIPLRKIILPTYRGRRGHPALFSVKYREEALRLKGEVGLRQILLEHPEDIVTVELNAASILQDIDTPEDYRQLKSKSPGQEP